jgi:hypothetical protein
MILWQQNNAPKRRPVERFVAHIVDISLLRLELTFLRREGRSIPKETLHLLKVERHSVHGFGDPFVQMP